MSQPLPYERKHDFTGFSVLNPADPAPGTWFDAEFNAVLLTLTGVLENLVQIQKDDGTLINQSVGFDQLQPDVVLRFQGVLKPRGIWNTPVVYAQGDVVTRRTDLGGTATYVCAVDHTSAIFASDLEAGRWNLLYSTDGIDVRNGSITTPKLADKAVTLDKVGFESLDLDGPIKAGSLTLGGAVVGGNILSVIAEDGNAVFHLARAHIEQGFVGFQLGGGLLGKDWEIGQETNSESIVFRIIGSVDQNIILLRGGAVHFGGSVMAKGWSDQQDGAGVEVLYQPGLGKIVCVDHATEDTKPLNVEAEVIRLVANGVVVGEVTSQGANFTALSVDGEAVTGGGGGGQTGSTRVFSVNTSAISDDVGNSVVFNGVALQTYTIPEAITASMALWSRIRLLNIGNDILNIMTPGVELFWVDAPGHGYRILSPWGQAYIEKVGPSRLVIYGTGIG